MTNLNEFLAAFYPDDAETIRLRQFSPKTAPPHILGSNKYLPKNIDTARRQLVEKTAVMTALQDANKTHGVYFVVNAGGHEDNAITRFNAFVVEDDAKSIEEQNTRLDGAPLLTSIRVQTKKSIHAYWLIESNASREDWQEVQGRLIAFFGSDATIKNPSRVMRLPFFNHVEYVPADDALAYKPVTLDQFEPSRRYSVEQMRAAFPPVPVQTKSVGKATRQSASTQLRAVGKVTTLASVLERQRNGEALNRPVIAPGDYSDGEIEQADAALIEGTIERISLQLANAVNRTKDSTLFECGLILYGLSKGGLADEERITETLLDAVALAGQGDPTFDLSHARQTARHAYERATATALDDLRGRQRSGAEDLREPESETANRTTRADPPALSKSWADFDCEEYPQGEQIAFTVERGEIALMNALPNAGKTTLALNAAIALAAGREFASVVTGRTPRRVLYIDGETRRARLQRDLRTMTKDFSREDAMAVGRNLHVICEAEIKQDSLTLTRTDHLLQLSVEALRVKPDFIVVDTLASLCPVFNENDNAEQTRKVWRPLQKLARDCDAAILVLHHVGKRNEDGQSAERVYRGRGASAAGGAARSVWLLTPDAVTRGLSTLACVKAKGDPPDDVRLQLDFPARWMRVHVAAPVRPVTPLERVMVIVTREMRAVEIKATLKSEFSGRTIEDTLAEALQLGKLQPVKRGVYAPIKSNSAETAETANGDFAEAAEAAESGQNPPESPLPQLPQSPIGIAETAETVSSNESNGLGEKRKNSKKSPLRKRAGAGNGHLLIPQSPMVSAEVAELGREVAEVAELGREVFEV